MVFLCVCVLQLYVLLFVCCVVLLGGGGFMWGLGVFDCVLVGVWRRLVLCAVCSFWVVLFLWLCVVCVCCWLCLFVGLSVVFKSVGIVLMCLCLVMCVCGCVLFCVEYCRLLRV